jgi:hypothetical protein
MSRERCYRCFWPKALCWCDSIRPMPTRTKFVFLMHPKEYKDQRTGTGRLTHLCLADSELHMGIGFDEHEAVQALIRDPANLPMLLYPGPQARVLPGGLQPEELAGRRLVVFLLDGTWACAAKMLRLSPSLQAVAADHVSAGGAEPLRHQAAAGDRVPFDAGGDARTAPRAGARGLDRYALPEQLPGLFHRMQDFLIRCAQDPSRPGYRRQPYGTPGERRETRGPGTARPLKLFPAATAGTSGCGCVRSGSARRVSIGR